MAVVLLAVATSTTARAQDSIATAKPGTYFSATVGLPGVGRGTAAALAVVGVDWSTLRPGHPGAAVAIGTAPYADALGLFTLGLRPGVVLPLALTSHLLVVPSAGVSIVLVGGGFGGGGTFGANAGASAILLGADGTGLRIGVTWHRFLGDESRYWLAETGVIWSVP